MNNYVMSNSIEIYKFVFHWQNMLHKKFNQEDLATFFKHKELIHGKEKVCLRFKLFKNF